MSRAENGTANTKAPEMDHFHTCRANLDETSIGEVRFGFNEVVDTSEDEVDVADEIDRDERARGEDCKE